MYKPWPVFAPTGHYGPILARRFFLVFLFDSLRQQLHVGMATPSGLLWKSLERVLNRKAAYSGGEVAYSGVDEKSILS